MQETKPVSAMSDAEFDAACAARSWRGPAPPAAPPAATPAPKPALAMSDAELAEAIARKAWRNA